MSVSRVPTETLAEMIGWALGLLGPAYGAAQERAVQALDVLAARCAQLEAAHTTGAYLIAALQDVVNEIPRRDLDEAFEAYGRAASAVSGTEDKQP